MITRTIEQKLVSQCMLWNSDWNKWWKFDVELDREWKRGHGRSERERLNGMLREVLGSEFSVHGFQQSQDWVDISVPSIPFSAIKEFVNTVPGASLEEKSVRKNGRWVSPRNP